MKRPCGLRDFGAMTVLVIALAAAGCTPAKKAAPDWRRPAARRRKKRRRTGAARSPSFVS